MYLRVLTMNILQENKIVKIIKMEIAIFCIFSILGLFVNFYTPCHEYFNKGDIVLSFNGLIGLFGTMLMGLFFWIILLFPLVYVAQLIILLKLKVFKKSLKLVIALTSVFLISILILFSLFLMDIANERPSNAHVSFTKDNYQQSNIRNSIDIGILKNKPV